MRSTPEKMLPKWSRIVRNRRNNKKSKKKVNFRVFSKSYCANWIKISLSSIKTKMKKSLMEKNSSFSIFAPRNTCAFLINQMMIQSKEHFLFSLRQIPQKWRRSNSFLLTSINLKYQRTFNSIPMCI